MAFTIIVVQVLFEGGKMKIEYVFEDDTRIDKIQADNGQIMEFTEENLDAVLGFMLSQFIGKKLIGIVHGENDETD